MLPDFGNLPLTVLPADAPRETGVLLDGASDLQQLCREHELFTPAMLCLYGGLDRDPVFEFHQHHFTADPALQPFSVDFPEQVFQLKSQTLAGAVIPWGHRLYAIHRTRWPQCLGFLGAIAITDPARTGWVRACSYTLQLVDRERLKAGGLFVRPPAVPVTVFAAATASETWHLAAASTLGVPAVVRGQAQVDMLLPRAALLGLVPGEESSRKF